MKAKTWTENTLKEKLHHYQELLKKAKTQEEKMALYKTIKSYQEFILTFFYRCQAQHNQPDNKRAGMGDNAVDISLCPGCIPYADTLCTSSISVVHHLLQLLPGNTEICYRPLL